MLEKVYIETSIVSYLTTARPYRNTVMQGHQEMTKLWWKRRRKDFHLCTSQYVLDEASVGDIDRVKDRLAMLDEIELLQIGDDAVLLAARLLESAALPSKARVDALHLAVAATNGVEYLLTWNCKHLANGHLWAKMDETCRVFGVRVPTICTPFTLIGDAYDPRLDC